MRLHLWFDSRHEATGGFAGRHAQGEVLKVVLKSGRASTARSSSPGCC
eukprot:CAMPEP_0206606106 /NCGR_PEP_ID=MMETSP0325_2-20121206/50995_1 /ASSEMBLY_ACC=CAM_ASM_000347 /TAXON_ID=2866 /ORGANISM="Crypthecodinium cohnii, Strain Seligo" /LENGTH=47 /DNA_ID= /DNA_START= /DNA_END= /DNA_ORIENTATION=